jgi:hypothetical protein
MHPDLPSDTREPDEPTELRFRGGTAGWENLRQTEDRDPPFRFPEPTNGLPAVGGKCGPEPDANSGERRASHRDHTWDAAPMEGFTRLSDRLLLWLTRIGIAAIVLFLVLLCCLIGMGVIRFFEWLARYLTGVLQ